MSVMRRTMKQYTATDGAAAITDHVLREVLFPRSDCLFITVTSSDNSYGSDVVSSVLMSMSVSAAADVNPSTGTVTHPARLLVSISVMRLKLMHTSGTVTFTATLFVVMI